MLELLAPAGSPECVPAAVQNGADAIYLGLDAFNARQGAKNFTRDEFLSAAAYCRVRGVKVYVTLNTLMSDRELSQASELVDFISAAGADAVLVQDLGALRMVKMTAPSLPVHASTQMSIHSLEGVVRAQRLGLSRVVLARELSEAQIAFIGKNSPIELEVFAHGALCVCHSGQCYFSSVIGRRSGNRGLCAQPCRLNYGFGHVEDQYPLSLRDLSLCRHLEALARAGVTAIKIEGRMRRPEYVALCTRIYSSALREKRLPTDEEMAALKAAFSRQGFTDAYFTGHTGREMFGVREEADEQATAKLFAATRKTYAPEVEVQRVEVRFYCRIREGRPAALAAKDQDGNLAMCEGEIPQPAYARPTIEAEVRTQLYKTGGTPYRCTGVQVQLDPGLMMPLSAINAMRRQVLEELTRKRTAPPERERGQYRPGVKYLARKEPPGLNLSVLHLRQLSPALAELKPNLIYVPLEELSGDLSPLEPFLGRCALSAELPPVITDNERPEMLRLLKRAKQLGFESALAGNFGHFSMIEEAGLPARGNFGLNVYNTQTLKELKHMGLKSATLSFELSLRQIADMSLCMEVELIVYGRLPLMITGGCIIKNRTGQHACENINELTDRTGARFPILKAHGCRNLILNSRKLWLADKEEDWRGLGLWGARLMFTTENPLECVQVVERHMGLGKYEPGIYTRGLYYRAVE